MYLEEISIYWLWKRKRLQRVKFSTVNIFTSSFILKQWHSNQLLRGRQGHLKSSCHRTQTLYMSCFECRTQKTWNLEIVCQPNFLSCVITFDPRSTHEAPGRVGIFIFSRNISFTKTQVNLALVFGSNLPHLWNKKLFSQTFCRWEGQGQIFQG